ncbi:Hpt domain-containing protein [Arthrobacter sp. 24S4-2]|nr:Hpt domain-containing protein [Arthrobacter sp. 24S4-2]
MSAPVIPVMRGQGKGCPMDGQDGVSRTYVDPSVLQTLRCELEPDAEYCTVFVNSYIQQLPRRLDRLRLAVETMDMDAAMDAVLSVKTSSMMVGAAYLSTLADELETILRHLETHPESQAERPHRHQLALLESMDACTDQTVAGLSAAAAA